MKIVTNKLGEKYLKKKGVITKVEDRYQAVVKMLDTNDKIRVDQAHVETVIPAIGKSNDLHSFETSLYFRSRKNSLDC